jgi:hypothetical protein
LKREKKVKETTSSFILKSLPACNAVGTQLLKVSFSADCHVWFVANAMTPWEKSTSANAMDYGTAKKDSNSKD